MVTSETAARLLSVSEVAVRLRVSRVTAYRLIRRGDLPAFQVGGSIRVDPDELEQFLRAARAGHPDRED